MAGSASATSPITAGAPPQGQVPPEQGDGVTQLVDQVREVGAQIDEIGASNPALSTEVAQIKQIMRSMIVKAAQAATVQTQSALSLPTGQGM